MIPPARRLRFIVLCSILVCGLAAVMFVRWRNARIDADFASGRQALARGDFSDVKQCIQSLESFGSESRAHLLRGFLQARTGNPQAALKSLSLSDGDQALLEPQLLLEGECLYRLGQLAEAERKFRMLAFRAPDSADVHRWLGAIYYDVGALEAAIAHLQLVAQLDPIDFSPHHLLGQIYFDFEKDTEAIDHLRKGLRLPAHADRHLAMQRLLIRSLMRHRKYAEALEVLTDLQADGWTLAMQADALSSLGRKQEAQAKLAEAKTLNPEERLILSVESRFHLDAGEIEQAVPLLERLLELDPNDAESRYQLALAYKRLERTEQSESEMKIYEETKEAIHTLAELNRKAMVEPKNAELRDEIADLCERLGKKEMTVVWRQAAAAIRKMNTPEDLIGRTQQDPKPKN